MKALRQRAVRILVFIALTVLIRPALVQAQPAPQASPPVLDPSTLTADQCRALAPNGSSCPSGMNQEQCNIFKSRISNRCKEFQSTWIDWEKLADHLRKYAAELSFALISAALITLVAWLRAKIESLKSTNQILTTTARTLEDRIFDPFFKRPDEYDQFATNMILIGEGGSGKTTIIHALTGADEARPDIATNQVSTYTLVNELTVETKGRVVRRLFRIYIDDYVGQNWVQATNMPPVRKRQEYVRSSTLVIVVDIFPPMVKLQPVTRREHAQKLRVKEHLQAYNGLSLQTLRNLLGENGQIVLFINKMDLLHPLTDEAREEAIRLYQPLIEDLAEIRGVGLHVIAGSAATGWGIVGYDRGQTASKSLYKVVLEHAEKIGPIHWQAMQDGRTTEPAQSDSKRFK